MEYLQILNNEQKRAVISDSQYIRVNAGAGSGKTRVLASRIAYLIDHYGIAHRSILAITFTNKVAKEMKNRVAKMLGVEQTNVGIFTYHAFCVRFLREEIKALDNKYTSNFTIIDDDDQLAIIKPILKDLEIAKEMLTPNNALSYISLNKNENVSVDKADDYAKGFVGEELKAKVYRRYEEYLTKNYYLDFDDLILKSVQILRKNSQIRKRWNERIDYILVDEFQDTNNLQYELLKLLMDENTKLFVVGDPDQTIYSWRGANIRLILNFNQDFKGVEDIILNRNYRSSANILKGANSLIKNNTSRLPKDLLTENNDGDRIVYYQAGNEENEALWVLEKIKQLRATNTELCYKDFVVLYRSNYYTRNFEQILLRLKMPYRIFGGIRFFQRKEVKDALCYLRLITNPNDDQAFLRIINEPRRGVGDKSIDELKTRSMKDNTSLYYALSDDITIFRKKEEITKFINAVEKARALLENEEILFSDVMNTLLESCGYYEMYNNQEEVERIENLRELQAYLIEMQKESPTKSLIEILQEVPVQSSQDEMDDGDYISLMTVHTAKGLEFPYVFIIGMSEGIFPNARAVGESKEGIEEERRLCYVAVTRAMRGLYLSDCRGYDFVTNTTKETSMFIGELDESLNWRKNKPKSSFTTHSKSNQSYKSYIASQPSATYRLGMMVEHTAFGSGIIIGIESGAIRVTFKDSQYGTKLISTNFQGIKVIGE